MGAWAGLVRQRSEAAATMIAEVKGGSFSDAKHASAGRLRHIFHRNFKQRLFKHACVCDACFGPSMVNISLCYTLVTFGKPLPFLFAGERRGGGGLCCVGVVASAVEC